MAPQLANSPPVPLDAKWRQFMADLTSFAETPVPLLRTGRLVRVSGIVLEAVGIALPVGSTCHIEQPGNAPVEAEVVGFSEGSLFLMAVSDVYGLMPGAKVIPNDPIIAAPKPGFYHHPWRRPEDRSRQLPIGDGLLGRVVSPEGHPLDRAGAIVNAELRPIRSRPINPIEREPIREVLDVGVRSINALLTVGRGQRIGLFAGSGVGKSVLLGMMARYTAADVIVVGLIGERGREVKEFIEEILGEEGRRRAVVVAAPADVPPLLRMQGAMYATAVAEFFRDQGKHVLLLMDSLTRYAMAHREIALSIGEPPATKGYPPSVFAKLPALVERAGMGADGRGSITAFYTVLAEGDDQQDPVADSARAILDGHIVLSRRIAESGHYPAIDIEQSISRVMSAVTEPSQQEAARRLKSLVSRYQRNQDLIAVGAYVPGSDPILDAAIRLNSDIVHFLQQPMQEKCSFNDARRHLERIHTAAATGTPV
jgi:flagellum-specific ATP synthase